MSSIIEDREILTNIELRAFCLALSHAGWSDAEVAEATGVVASRVWQFRHHDRPTRVRMLTRHIDSIEADRRVCQSCGVDLVAVNPQTGGSQPPPTARVCMVCRRADEEATRQQRHRVLLAWADRHQRVPTVREASAIVGVGRSFAGDLVLAVFGADDRLGATRRGRRAWPPMVAVSAAAASGAL